jgi:hypothetical protein
MPRIELVSEDSSSDESDARAGATTTEVLYFGFSSPLDTSVSSCGFPPPKPRAVSPVRSDPVNSDDVEDEDVEDEDMEDDDVEDDDEGDESDDDQPLAAIAFDHIYASAKDSLHVQMVGFLQSLPFDERCHVDDMCDAIHSSQSSPRVSRVDLGACLLRLTYEKALPPGITFLPFKKTYINKKCPPGWTVRPSILVRSSEQAKSVSLKHRIEALAAEKRAAARAAVSSAAAAPLFGLSATLSAAVPSFGLSAALSAAAPSSAVPSAPSAPSSAILFCPAPSSADPSSAALVPYSTTKKRTTAFPKIGSTTSLTVVNSFIAGAANTTVDDILRGGSDDEKRAIIKELSMYIKRWVKTGETAFFQYGSIGIAIVERLNKGSRRADSYFKHNEFVTDTQKLLWAHIMSL